MGVLIQSDPDGKLPYLRDGGVVTGPPPLATPVIHVLVASPAISVLEGESAVLRVSLEPAITAGNVTFSYTTVAGTALAGTDYTATSGTGTITAGLTFTDITVPTISRVGTNGSRAFTVVISNALLSGTTTLGITNATATVTIADVGAGTVLPTLGIRTLGNQPEGTSITFEAAISKTHGSDVTFSYATSNATALAGTDYTTKTGTGTITAGQQTTTVAVVTASRAGYQGARSFTFTISNGSDSVNTITIHTPTATGTITDTEAPTSGGHAYFDTMIARADYYTGYAMRPVAGQDQYYPDGHAHAGKRNPYYANQLTSYSAGTSPHSASNTGGYVNTTSGFNTYLYNPGADTHAEAQDALRTHLNTWVTGFTLKTAMLDSDTSMTLTTVPSSTLRNNGISWLIDNEVVITNGTSGQVLDGTGGITMPILRAQNLTSAVAHSAGVAIKRCNNVFWPQFRPPVGTSDGNTYLFSWDFYVPLEHMRPLGPPMDYYKAFQFGSTGAGSTPNWLELQTRWLVGSAYQPPTYNRDTHIGVATWRYYGALTSQADWSIACAPYASTSDDSKKIYRQGYLLNRDPIYPTPNATSQTVDLQARNGGFLMWPGRWNRVYVYFRQNANDWDDMWMWMCDEVQEPFTMHQDLKLSIGKGGSIANWWIEHQTSQANFTRPWSGIVASPGALPILPMYQRNFFALKNPGTDVTNDILPLLEKPVA